MFVQHAKQQVDFTRTNHIFQLLLKFELILQLDAIATYPKLCPKEGRPFLPTFCCQKNSLFRKNCHIRDIWVLQRNNFTVDVLLNEKLPKSCQSLPSSSSNSSPATRGINTSPVSPSKSCVEWCFGDRDFEKRTAIFSESLSAFIMRSCAKPANSGGYSNDFVNVNDFTKRSECLSLKRIL